MLSIDYLATISCLVISIQLSAQVVALPHAHSHNDYEQECPLKDALAHGFTSVEADVLYIYGKLKVAHEMPDKPRPRLKTLEQQYLKPLFKQFKKNNKQIYENYEGDFYLWVDIKTDSEKVYQLLKQQLWPYRDMLNYYNSGTFHKGKVTVILSGNRPFETLLKDPLQLMTLDGRPEDLKEDFPSHLVPFISEHAGKVAQVTDYSQVDEAAFRRIAHYVELCRQQGKKTRLWATPEDEGLWTKLLSIGIDLINTDDLPRLKDYLSKK